MHAGREEAPLSYARDEGEARLLGCLLLLPTNCYLSYRWDGTFVSQRCFGRFSIPVLYQ